MTGRSSDDKLNLAVMQVLRKDGLSFGPRTADYLGVTAVHDSIQRHCTQVGLSILC